MDLDKVKDILESDYGYSNLKEETDHSWFIDSILKDAIEIVKLNYTHSSLQFKKIEKPTFEEFKQEFFIKESRCDYTYRKTGELWKESQVISRYKSMYE